MCLTILLSAGQWFMQQWDLMKMKHSHLLIHQQKVALATAQSAELPNTMHGVGELEAARQVYLAAETNGRIATIHFASGQTVTRDKS